MSASPVTRFGPTLALTVALATGGFLTLLGAVLLVNHPAAVACLPMTQNQDAETLLYLSAFLLVLPLSLAIGPRLADRLAHGPHRSAVSAVTGLLVAALALAILTVKALNGLPWATAWSALAASVVWWSAAITVFRRATRPVEWATLTRLSKATTPICTVAGLLVFAVVLSFADLGAMRPRTLLIGAACVIGGVIAHERGRWPSWGRRWRLGIDILAVGLVLLVVPDLLIVQPELAAVTPQVAIDTAIIQFHQDFLLGPANELLAGGVLLRDTASQYGVTLIYMLAGWFTMAPIGYGTLGFFSGALNALVFAVAYGILRLAGVSRVVASGTLGVAVITLVFNTDYPINAIPQNSALRFVMPFSLLLPMVAASRWPRLWPSVWGGVVTIVGLSSIWSLEACVYSLATAAPLVGLEAWLRHAGSPHRWLLARVRDIALACLIAHLLFAALTVAASGHLPDWTQYLAYLRAFLFEPLGDLNFDYAFWSPGLLVGAVHLMSAAGVLLLVIREPELVRAERTTMVALTGVTAYGVAIFSYFNNRSTDFVLAGVSLPAFLAVALWLRVLLRPDRLTRLAQRGVLAGALGAAVLLVAAGAPVAGERYAHSALAHLLPGGGSLRDALHRLWHLPPLSPASVEGRRLLDEYMPSARRSLVLATPALQVEILLRSQRGNTLPLASPWQDSFIPTHRLPGLRRAVEGLRAGDRLLIDDSARRAFTVLRADASIDPLARGCKAGSAAEAPSDLAPLQYWALKAIGERFDMEPIEQSESGLAIVALIPRR